LPWYSISRYATRKCSGYLNILQLQVVIFAWIYSPYVGQAVDIYLRMVPFSVGDSCIKALHLPMWHIITCTYVSVIFMQCTLYKKWRPTKMRLSKADRRRACYSLINMHDQGFGSGSGIFSSPEVETPNNSCPFRFLKCVQIFIFVQIAANLYRTYKNYMSSFSFSSKRKSRHPYLSKFSQVTQIYTNLRKSGQVCF